MDRRILGGAVVALAVLALPVVNRVSGRDLPGQATAVPPIPVPAAGACVRFEDPRSVLVAGVSVVDPVVVRCSEEHHAEVMQAWRADPADHQTGVDPAGGCGPMLFANSGSDWAMPPLSTDSQLVDVGGPIGWSGCLVAPVDADHSVTSYSGAMADLGSVAELPVALRYCFGHRESGDSGPVSPAPFESTYPGYERVPCTFPHSWELIGVKPGDADSDGCRELATTLVRSAAPFAADPALQVQVLVDYSPITYTVAVDPAAAGQADLAEIPVGAHSCAVGAPAGRLLTDSVIGLGDRPLPWD